MTIDQLTLRRIMRTGLTAHNPAKALEGYILYCPLNTPLTLLLDRKGEVVHRWTHDVDAGQWAYLLPNGNLFYMAKVRDENWQLWPTFRYFKGGAMREITWDGKIVWEHRDPFQHHDARRTPEGGVIYLSTERIPAEISKKIKGGHAVGDAPMYADKVVEVDAKGKVIWEWRVLDHLDPEREPTMFNVPRFEWTHVNTIVPLEGERIMLSARHLSSVFIIEKATGKIVERIGGLDSDLFVGQHDPKLRKNGNLLIFDNGTYRSKFGIVPSSRILEIDRATKQIVWEYKDTPHFYFYSPHISGVDELPNNNLLITEGARGRMFEVTREKEVVWEYINPHFEVGPMGETNNTVYKARFYKRDQIPALV
jgi:Arylsulfotransferase (ASST)